MNADIFFWLLVVLLVRCLIGLGSSWWPRPGVPDWGMRWGTLLATCIAVVCLVLAYLLQQPEMPWQS